MALFKRTIVLIGPMGAGKSTVGALLAERLSFAHYDSDRELTKKYGRIDAIFAEQGEDRFRLLEYRCAKELLLALTGKVVSLGGGAPIKLQEELSGHLVVYLSARWDDVVSRLLFADPQDRPLLRRNAGRESVRQEWEDLAASRRTVYERLATLTVDVGAKSPEDIAAEILGALENPNDKFIVGAENRT